MYPQITGVCPWKNAWAFFKDILGNEEIGITTKNELTSQTLTHLYLLFDTFKEQVRAGEYATTEPIKKAKEDLNQIFLDLLPL